MTDDPDTATGEAGTEKRALTRSERILIRISITQTIVAVLGIFTGAVALYAALNEADAVRKQQQAAVWPELLLGYGDRGDSFVMIASNTGIGPARMRAFRVRLDGEPHTSWSTVVGEVLQEDQPAHALDFISQRTIRPEQDLEFLTITGVDRTAAMAEAVSAGRVVIDACYCSVFEECWSIGLFELSEPVDACPDYGDETFTE